MKKETKLGLFAFLVLAITIWGYYYLKGRNLLASKQVFYVEYADIGELMISSPVKISGYQVGTVSAIELDETDLQTVRVSLIVDSGIRIPASAKAMIEPAGIMGGAVIVLRFDRPCQGEDCADSGDVLQGGTASLMSKMLDEDQLSSYMEKLKAELSTVMDTLDVMSQDPNSRTLVGGSLYDTRQILENTRVTTAELAVLVNRVGAQLTRVMDDLQTVTGGLRSSNKDIGGILGNTHAITAQVKDADLGATISASRETMARIDTSVAELAKVTAELQVVLERINKGEGTVGKLVQDPAMYENLLRTSKNIELLLQDVRLNPKRYINVSVFGGKQKDYSLPEKDPAYPQGK